MPLPDVLLPTSMLLVLIVILLTSVLLQMKVLLPTRNELQMKGDELRMMWLTRDELPR